jgi:hypothetical protein
MKILLIHPPEEISHHASNGRTRPATANAQYHRLSMLPRRVHNGLCIGAMMFARFSMDGTLAAALMSTLEKLPLLLSPCVRRNCAIGLDARQSQAAATDSAPQ